jgi:superfamily II DNA or RNA helicase
LITDYHAKFYAHELGKRHSVADIEKLAGTLFDAQVDLNPHQVEAALFAFKSPLSKGAILADEVGLGKTIEAGLVLAQKWTEGKRRVLIIAPANLRKQWSQEIAEKFFLPSIILEAKNYNKIVKDGIKRPFEQKTLIICSYQFAARHADELMMVPWDLVVIDEAHRLRNVYRPDNRIGRTLKTALSNAPKILLTATPLQNSLMELYGLVSLIDDYTFGDAKSFRAQYARLTGNEEFDELKTRLSPVCHRTLRRQVLEYIRYTNRIPVTQEFSPSEPEQKLYDMVLDYLQSPTLQALPSSQRSLMTLILRKLLASSTFAIAGALDSLANKLERQLKNDKGARAKLEEEISDDYEGFEEAADEWEEPAEEPRLLTEQDICNIESEIVELRAFHELAVSITENAKGLALISALRVGFEKAAELGSAQKAIIFTESRRTQEYLVRLLYKNSYEDKLVLFNGNNTDASSKKIYNAWIEQHKGTDRITGSRTADMRAALVEHFRDKASIMIATEAAAEGINLQFCSIIVNYDLPWNPQRIEQRIGRCHRYGQRYDVVVVNFLNKNNAADQRVHELLAEKFKLFSGVFGASDDVLGAIESGIDFEKRIISIYQTCRCTEDIEIAFEKLKSEMDANITAAMEDTRRKLLENFDAEVHDRLKINMQQSKDYLDRYMTMLWQITKHELAKNATFDDHYNTFSLKVAPNGVSVPTGSYFMAKHGIDGHRYRLGHPLAQHVLNAAVTRKLNGAQLIFDYTDWPQKAVAIEPLIGKAGTMMAHRLSVRGVDDQDHVSLAAITDDGNALDSKTAMRLFDLPVRQEKATVQGMDETVSQSIQQQRNAVLNDIAVRQAAWFDDELEKLDNWAEDKRTGLKSDLKELDDEVKALKRAIRQTGNLPDKLTLQRQARALETKRDEAWRAYDDAARKIDVQKDDLLDQVEKRLGQNASDEELFTIRFKIK